MEWINVYVHDREQVVFNGKWMGKMGFIILTTFSKDQRELEKIEGKRFYYRFSPSISLKTSNDHRPCDSDNRQRPFLCATDFVASKTGCANHSSENCSESAFRDATNAVFTSPGFKALHQLTGCVPNCKTASYTLQEFLHLDLDSKQMLELSFSPAIDDDLIMEKEIYLYQFGDFVADFGGYLGLLLGASLLSIYDQVSTIVGKAKLCDRLQL